MPELGKNELRDRERIGILPSRMQWPETLDGVGPHPFLSNVEATRARVVITRTIQLESCAAPATVPEHAPRETASASARTSVPGHHDRPTRSLRGKMPRPPAPTFAAAETQRFQIPTPPVEPIATAPQTVVATAEPARDVTLLEAGAREFARAARETFATLELHALPEHVPFTAETFDAAAYYGRLRADGPTRAHGERTGLRLDKRWACALLLLSAAGALTAYYALAPGYEITHNAQIDMPVTQLSAQIAGSVRALHVQPNQNVQAGDLLLELDASELQLRMSEAKARLNQAQAALQSEANPAEAAQLTAARALVATAEAKLRASAREQSRWTAELAAAQAVVHQPEPGPPEPNALELAHARVAAAQLALMREVERGQQLTAAVAEAQVQLAEQERDAAAAQHTEQVTELDAAREHYQEAKRQLALTKIVAPHDGVVGPELANVGEQVAPGRALLSLWSDNHPWVTASFDETQLPKLHVGAVVQLHVIALDLHLQGRIESLAFGSEARLKHAAGGFANYDASVPQRMPVRIAVPNGQDGLDRLRPGMTVETRVRVR